MPLRQSWSSRSFLVPIVALLVCGAAVWRWKARWRVGWLILTVLAMCGQVGFCSSS